MACSLKTFYKESLDLTESTKFFEGVNHFFLMQNVNKTGFLLLFANKRESKSFHSGIMTNTC